jgi:PAS domain-containing protein
VDAARGAAEARFRAVSETAGDAIVTADQRGRIVYVNRAAERLFDRGAAEAVGQPLTLLMPERFHDVTERKRAEATVRDVLESAPDAMLLVRADGAIALVNGAGERLFGYGRDALIGRPVEMLIPERLRRRRCAAWTASPARSTRTSATAWTKAGGAISA